MFVRNYSTLFSLVLHILRLASLSAMFVFLSVAVQVFKLSFRIIVIEHVYD